MTARVLKSPGRFSVFWSIFVMPWMVFAHLLICKSSSDFNKVIVPSAPVEISITVPSIIIIIIIIIIISPSLSIFFSPV